MKALTILDFGAEGTIAQGAEVKIGTQRNVKAATITQGDFEHFAGHGALPKPKATKSAAKKATPKTTDTGETT